MPVSSKTAVVITLAILSCTAFGQSTSGEPIKVTLCELVKRPKQFDGKLVQFRATVRNGFEASLLIDDTCSARIWFTGPGATYVSFGKLPAPRGPQVKLQENEAYRAMQGYLNEQYVPKDKRSICMGCPLYTVTITATGRFDHVERPSSDLVFGRPGFGHLNAFDSQLVLQSVTDVDAKAIDTSVYEKP